MDVIKKVTNNKNRYNYEFKNRKFARERYCVQ